MMWNLKATPYPGVESTVRPLVAASTVTQTVAKS